MLEPGAGRVESDSGRDRVSVEKEIYTYIEN